MFRIIAKTPFAKNLKNKLLKKILSSVFGLFLCIDIKNKF